MNDRINPDWNIEKEQDWMGDPRELSEPCRIAFYVLMLWSKQAEIQRIEVPNLLTLFLVKIDIAEENNGSVLDALEMVHADLTNLGLSGLLPIDTFIAFYLAHPGEAGYMTYDINGQFIQVSTRNPLIQGQNN
jgi:hypothetical protein